VEGSKTGPNTAEPIAQPIISELRFTRSRHATVFFALALAFFLISVVTLILRQYYYLLDPAFGFPRPTWGWILAPVPVFALLAAVGLYLLRTPFLVVSRLGIEIHPLLPREELDHITWVEIAGARLERRQSLLELTLNTEEQSKIFITLCSIHPRSYPLLEQVVARTLEYRAKASSGRD
jgi:hypothetical protein